MDALLASSISCNPPESLAPLMDHVRAMYSQGSRISIVFADRDLNAQNKRYCVSTRYMNASACVSRQLMVPRFKSDERLKALAT